MPVFLLSDKFIFPSAELAGNDGLLAVGGDLKQKRLLLAYQMGIFPWFSDGDPILWWSPDPRLVLYPPEIKISRSLQRLIRKQAFQITMDTAFERVVRECVSVRIENDEDTWITEEMIDAYCRLHASGYAHSVEVWSDGRIAGGLYGVSLGRCFFGESMFTRIANGSKVALVALTRYLTGLSFTMIDCQVTSDHLLRFGAREIPRQDFLEQLKGALDFPTIRGRWAMDEKTINRS
jgi:leucyl/phenylalanyl-tRNA---protein transferase